MARQRNNIYAMAADAFDLALDTAGTIGSMVGGIANGIGLGNSSGQEKSERQEQLEVRKDVDDAAERMTTTIRQEAEAVKPRSHKVSHKRKTARRPVSKARSTKSVKRVAKRRAA